MDGWKIQVQISKILYNYNSTYRIHHIESVLSLKQILKLASEIRGIKLFKRPFLLNTELMRHVSLELMHK